jgi:peptidoglycan/LPS O-acetylase OafA/YrhL
MNIDHNPTQTRYHDLDALRAVMMFLGLVIHVSLSFVEPLVPIWPASDSDPSLFYTVLCYFIHSFRMQIFFLIAGFFGAMLWKKRGGGGYLSNRLKRIGVPLLVAGIVLVPLLQALWVIGFQRVSQQHLDAAARFQPRLDIEKYRVSVVEFFRSGAFLENYILYHLWFLEYLLVFVLVMYFLAPSCERVLSRTGAQRCLRFLFASRGKWLWLSLTTLIFFSGMKGRAGVDTPTHFLPEPQILVYYGWFFFLGWCLHSQIFLIRKLGEYWRWYFVVALFVMLPINLSLTVTIRETNTEVKPILWWAYRFTYCVLTWMFVMGFIGLFQRYASQPKKWFRYLADSSYWVYLVHLPIVVALQIIFSPLNGSGTMKFITILLITLITCLASYHLFVRNTFIGIALNGQRRD